MPARRRTDHSIGIAEFERNLIKERTRAGLEAARARGRKGGGPKRLNSQQRSLAVDLFRQKKHSIHEICITLGITKPTVYAYVQEATPKNALTPANVQN